MIKRYFSEENFYRLQKDFGFLHKFISSSYGEFDLSLRDGYFNIYYKGNSLAKVVFMKNGKYKVSIHSKFIKNTSADNPEYYDSCVGKNTYYYIDLSAKKLCDKRNEFLTKLSPKVYMPYIDPDGKMVELHNKMKDEKKLISFEQHLF